MTVVGRPPHVVLLIVRAGARYKGHALSAHDKFSRFVLSPEFTAFERRKAAAVRLKKDAETPHQAATAARRHAAGPPRKRQDLTAAEMKTAELALALGILRRHEALVEEYVPTFI